jgi:hypothetical protein
LLIVSPSGLPPDRSIAVTELYDSPQRVARVDVVFNWGRVGVDGGRTMVNPRLRYDAHGVQVWHGDARDVAAMQAPGSFSLAIVDGPYAMRKAEWDRMKVADLPDWYAPHLDDIDRLCAPSASLYLWNTAEGWATLHPGIVACGWSFKVALVWDKRRSIAAMNPAVQWGDVAEICGYYTRGHVPVQKQGETTSVWRTDLTARDAETLRGPAPRSSGSVTWTALHPCQKPLAFADRMIRASTRPGDRVWAPFGGTCREALATKLLNERDPANARECVTAEIDMDGRNYLDAVVRVLEGRGVKPEDPKQPDLF